MGDFLSTLLSDPFELFRFVLFLLAFGELGALVWDWRAGYKRWYRALESRAGSFHVHELLRATLRLQMARLLLRPLGWAELKIVLVQSAALACGVLTWFLN